MSQVSLTFVDGAPVGVPNITQIIAVIGFCSAVSPLAAPLKGQKKPLPRVFYIDDGNQIPDLGGAGTCPELASAVNSRGNQQTIMVASECSVPAYLSPVTQSGPGPLVTCAPFPATVDQAAGPYDDGFCDLIIASPETKTSKATYQLAYTYVPLQGQMVPLPQPAQSVPPRMAATVIGTKNLANITYALPASITGIIDLDGIKYGPGGDLDGKDFTAAFDGPGQVSFVFPTLGSPQQIADTINTKAGMKVASITQQNTLMLTSTKFGGKSEVNLISGSSLAVLGLKAADIKGTPGDLDGKDMTVVTDQGVVTVTFDTPEDPADVIDYILKQGDPELTGDLYTASDYLRISSTTVGDASSLKVTGGSALPSLGLSIMGVPAVGSESRIRVPHLGIEFTIQPGVLKAGTTWSVSMRAARPSTDDIKEAVDAVYASQNTPFGIVCAHAAPDAMTAFGEATALAQMVGQWQNAKHYPHIIYGITPEEDDAVIKSQFQAFESWWVDLCARGAYCVGTESGGGGVLRPASWPRAVCGAAIPYDMDVGDNSVSPNPIGPYVIGVTAIEDASPVRLVRPVGSSGISMNVLNGVPGDYRFTGGYSSAPGLSAWSDQSTRNCAQAIALAVLVILKIYINATRGIITDVQGHLSAGTATAIGSNIERFVSGIMGAAVQSISVQVDTTEIYAKTKTIKAKVVFTKAPPAREVSGTIGPIAFGISSSGGLTP